jgi:hypothetical protein
MFHDRFIKINSQKIKELLLRLDLVRMHEFGQDKDGISPLGCYVFFYKNWESSLNDMHCLP